jgi:hypothetical protein
LKKYLISSFILVCVLVISIFLFNGKSGSADQATQKLNQMFPEFSQFSVTKFERAALSNREKVRFEWVKGALNIKSEFFYRIKPHEVQNLIKQNDLQIFNLFVKQPTPYPGVLTQQAGRDCSEDFVPAVENQEDTEVIYHRVDFLLQNDSNLGACSKEEVVFFARHVHQYCKQEEILLELTYQVPANEKDNNQFASGKLPCPQVAELMNLK